METEKYQRKPFEVDALRVTEENFKFCAGLCSGEIRTEKDRRNVVTTYIKIFVNRPLNEAQTKAYVGDWLLYTPSGWKIYKDGAFRNSFEKVQPAQDVMSAEKIQQMYEEAVQTMASFPDPPKTYVEGLENSVVQVMQETRDWETKAANLEGVVHRTIGYIVERQDNKSAHGGSIDAESRRWRGETTSEIMQAVTAMFAPEFLKKMMRADANFQRAGGRPIPGLKPLQPKQTYFPAKLPAEDLLIPQRIREIQGANAALTIVDEVSKETLEKVVDKLKHMDDEPIQGPITLSEFEGLTPIPAVDSALVDQGLAEAPENRYELSPELREQLLAKSKSVAHWMMDTELQLPGTFTVNQIREEFKREGLWNQGTEILPVVESKLRKFQKESIDYLAPLNNLSPKDRAIETYSMREPADDLGDSQYEYKPEDTQNH